MQYSNCPRCNTPVVSGSMVCPNCQLNLAQYGYQQTIHHHVPVAAETPQEKKYRKLVIVLAIIALSELVVYRIPEFLGEFTGSLSTVTRPLQWILELCWCGIPLAIALVLPKSNKVRVLFIVLGAIYALWQIYFYAHIEMMRNADPVENINF